MASLLPRSRTAFSRLSVLRPYHQHSTAATRPTALLSLRAHQPAHRPFSSADLSSSMSPAELAIASTLSSHADLRPTASVLVRDVSGGCGSMYAVDIASPRFRGLTLLQQQRLVTKALGDQVKEWHGVQIRTSVPPEGEGEES